jgi:putative aldouronate transport system substrate-binding protein
VQSFLPGEDENNNEIIRWLEKFSGYKLHYSILPQGAAAERLTLEFASGNPADMITAGGRTEFLQFATQGYLTDLGGYVSNNTMLQKTKIVEPTVYNMGIVNGKLYGIPTPTNGSAESDSLTGLKRYTEPAGITKGNMSLSHILNMFATAKKIYPDKVVLTGAGQETKNYILRGFNWLYGAFGVATSWREVSGRKQVEYTPLTRDMRDCLAFIADLTAKGYLDPEYGNLNIEKVREKMLNGNTVFSLMPWYGWGNALQWENPDTTPLWELYGNAVGTGGRSGQNIGAPDLGRYVMVPRTCKIPEAVVDYTAYVCQPEAYDFIFFGEKDIDYRENPDETRTNLGTKRRVSSGTNYSVYYYVYEDVAQRNMRLFYSYAGDKWYEIFTRVYGLETKSVLDPTVSIPAIPEYVNKISDINDLCAEYFLKIATGALPVSAFDEFLTRFDAIGGNDVVRAVNEWYANR